MKKKEKTNFSTGIYVRVSTEEQAQEGFSIRGQTEKLKSYAMLKEWDIYNIYSDEGISGKNIVDRPAINRLIDDIKKGYVDNVLVFKVDRLTRSTKNLIELVDLFEEHNCVFNSLTESIDTDTPSGRMFLKIIGIFAEFERENLACRVKLGIERKVKEGYSIASSTLSYGYTRKKGQKIQEVHPEEARIVKEIFSMFVEENMSMTKIATILNSRNVKTKNNLQVWRAPTIQNMLTNTTYIAKVRYAVNDKENYFEADGHHERIVSDEIFSLAQEKVERIRSNRPFKKHPKEEQYFCGVLVCALCGSKFTTHHGEIPKRGGDKTHRVSYRCPRKIYYSDKVACKCPSVRHHKVETAFVEYIQQINDFSNVQEINISNEQKEKERQEHLDYIAVCENKLKNLHNGKKRVMEQYVSEEITFEEYRELLEISNKKHEKLESELQKLYSEIPEEESSVSHDDIILSLKENWKYLNNKEKMIFLQRFVKKIVMLVEKGSTRLSVVKIKSVEFR